MSVQVLGVILWPFSPAGSPLTCIYTVLLGRFPMRPRAATTHAEHSMVQVSTSTRNKKHVWLDVTPLWYNTDFAIKRTHNSKESWSQRTRPSRNTWRSLISYVISWHSPFFFFFTIVYSCIFSGANHRSAQVLLLLVIPGHLIFLYTIHLMKSGHTSLTPIFMSVYLAAALLQVRTWWF